MRRCESKEYSKWLVPGLPELAIDRCGNLLPIDRRRRRIRRSVAATCGVLIAAVIGGWPVYVRPQIDHLQHADAIFVLGGASEHERLTVALDLVRQGWAQELVLSTAALSTTASRPTWLVQFCKQRGLGLKVDCIDPDPPTTKGEGRELRRLAEKYHWRTVIVVTFRPHISRARFILTRCFDGDLVMVASPAPLSVARWAYQYIYQTAGYVRVVFEPGC